MKDRDASILKKMLSEVSIAQGMMGNTCLGDFLEDEKLKRAV